MRSWVFLIFFILLSLSNSHALELFGYKLYDGIDQYINDGEVNFKKKLIENNKKNKFIIKFPKIKLIGKNINKIT